MLLSTQTIHFERVFGIEQGVELLCQIGYDALDFSLFSIGDSNHRFNLEGNSLVEKVRKIANDSNVIFNQTHAPFPSIIPGNDGYNKKMFENIVRSMEVSSILGAKIVIVHPSDFADKDLNKKNNLAFYNSLLPYCKEYKLKVALENMYGWDSVASKTCPNVCSTGEELSEYYDALDPNYFTVCLDLGHSGLVGGDAAQMIRALGKDRLGALHVHDNDFIRDSHTVPFLEKMDWDSITRALADIDYQGEFTFEADSFFSKVPRPLVLEGGQYLYSVGRYLIRQIGYYKGKN